MNEWKNELMNEKMNEWITEWMNYWMNEWMKEWMGEKWFCLRYVVICFQAEVLRICRDNLQKEREEKARKEREKSKELESLYTLIENIGGLWKTEEAVDKELAKLTTGRWGDQKLKLDALKTQILFRKKNLRQPFPAKLGAFLKLVARFQWRKWRRS